jgi:hypothetical protein
MECKKHARRLQARLRSANGAASGDRRSSARDVELNSWKGSLSRTETGSETRADTYTGQRQQGPTEYRNSVGNPPAGEFT